MTVIRHRVREILLVLAIATSGAHAADIRVVERGRDGIPVILVVGEFKVDDGNRFATLTESLPHAAVIFNSPGGALVAGLQMGTIIKLKRYETFSPEGALCASSCALAWLGGAVRYMQPQSRIGFHAAFDRETRAASGVGNALVGAYLSNLNVSFDAIVFMESAAADDVNWLTPAEARRLGIRVEVLASEGTLAKPKKADPVETPPLRAPPVALPSTSPQLEPRSTELPPNLPALVAPLAPEQRPTGLEEGARAFALAYFDHWSEANRTAIDFFSGAYAVVVKMYGQDATRVDVLARKRDFAMKWPVRVYSAHAETLHVFCNPETQICVVTGVVDWDCRRPDQNARTAGTANFSLTISVVKGRREILAESGSVINRGVD